LAIEINFEEDGSTTIITLTTHGGVQEVKVDLNKETQQNKEKKIYKQKETKMEKRKNKEQNEEDKRGTEESEANLVQKEIE